MPGESRKPNMTFHMDKPRKIAEAPTDYDDEYSQLTPDPKHPDKWDEAYKFAKIELDKMESKNWEKMANQYKVLKISKEKILEQCHEWNNNWAAEVSPWLPIVGTWLLLKLGTILIRWYQGLATVYLIFDRF